MLPQSFMSRNSSPIRESTEATFPIVFGKDFTKLCSNQSRVWNTGTCRPFRYQDVFRDIEAWRMYVIPAGVYFANSTMLCRSRSDMSPWAFNFERSLGRFDSLLASGTNWRVPWFFCFRRRGCRGALRALVAPNIHAFRSLDSSRRGHYTIDPDSRRCSGNAGYRGDVRVGYAAYCSRQPIGDSNRRYTTWDHFPNAPDLHTPARPTGRRADPRLLCITWRVFQGDGL